MIQETEMDMLREIRATISEGFQLLAVCQLCKTMELKNAVALVRKVVFFTEGGLTADQQMKDGDH